MKSHSKSYTAKFRLLPICVACAALTLNACTTPIVKEGDAPAGPEYVRWMPKEYRAPVEAQLPRPKELWWRDFQSEELNQIVETGITNNFDLRIAVARVAQTRAQAALPKLQSIRPSVQLAAIQYKLLILPLDRHPIQLHGLVRVRGRLAPS